MLRSAVIAAIAGSAAAFAPASLPLGTARRAAVAQKSAVSGISMQRFQGGFGNDWDVNGADWAVNGGLFGAVGDVIWAREAEVKHGRICMLASLGAIVQDVYTFPFMSK
eukprot:1583790-Rhodomonas_salina.1